MAGKAARSTPSKTQGSSSLKTEESNKPNKTFLSLPTVKYGKQHESNAISEVHSGDTLSDGAKKGSSLTSSGGSVKDRSSSTTLINKNRKKSVVNAEDLRQINKGKDSKQQKTFREELIALARRLGTAQPTGVLAVHIKQAHLHQLIVRKLFPAHIVYNHMALYIRLTTNDQAKFTRAYTRIKAPSCIIYDELKFFDLTFDTRDQTYHYLRMDIIAFNTSNINEHHQQLASKEIDILPIITEGCQEKKMEIFTPMIQLDLDIEFCFAYGSFGYGTSNLFYNEERSPTDLISWSMFCRLEPPSNRKIDPFNGGVTMLVKPRPNEQVTDSDKPRTSNESPNRTVMRQSIASEEANLLQIPRVFSPTMGKNSTLEISTTEPKSDSSAQRSTTVDELLESHPIINLLIGPSLYNSLREYSEQKTRRQRYHYLTKKVCHRLPHDSTVTVAPTLFKAVSDKSKVGGLYPDELHELIKKQPGVHNHIDDSSQLSTIPIRLPGSSRLFWPARAVPKVTTPEDAKLLALQLDTTGRQLLLEQIQQIQFNENTQQIGSTPSAFGAFQELTTQQLYRIFLYNGLPFIGFGVLDNGIMIVAGEYIDITIGVGLGISTMAAAALGNLVSDVAGVGTAGYVELLVAKFGVTPIELTTSQALSQNVRWTVAAGRALGIAFGCLIGMIPLLFFDKEEEDNKQMQKIAGKSSEVSSDEKSPSAQSEEVKK